MRATNQLCSVISSSAFSITVTLDPARTLQRLYGTWAAGKFPAATLNNAGLEATVWGMQANSDSDSAKNLKSAIEGETYEYTQMYPGFARVAREEGFAEAAEWFETLAKAEKSHAGRFTKGLETMA